MNHARVSAILVAGVTSIALALAVAAPARAAHEQVTSNDETAGDVGSPDDLAGELIKTTTFPAQEPEGPVGTERATTSPLGPLWVLNMNLCNSGTAEHCFDEEDRRAIPKAQEVMEDTMPDVVTLQEICEDDVIGDSNEPPLHVAPLTETMREMWQTIGFAVFAVFMPVLNGDGTDTVKCTEGRGDFGNAIIGRVPAWQGLRVAAGYYGVQDGNWRNYVCAYAIDNYLGCATHLTAGSKENALAQCHQLMAILPPLRDALGGYLPTVVGGDFNLQELDVPWEPEVDECVPDGWWRTDPGNLQRTHVMATDDFTRIDTSSISMGDATDHPALFVKMDNWP